MGENTRIDWSQFEDVVVRIEYSYPHVFPLRGERESGEAVALEFFVERPQPDAEGLRGPAAISR